MSAKPAAVERPARNLATQEEVAEYLQIPWKTLAHWRYLRTEIPFVKAGRQVRYDWADVIAWQEASKQQIA